MKKISLIGAITLLAACSSKNLAPVEQATNNDMNQGTKKPDNSIIISSEIPAQTMNEVKPEVITQQDTKEPKQEITITFTDNKPNYGQITKGSYQNSYYTVKAGDTMYYISYISGVDIAEIEKLNNLMQPYTLQPGQVLTLRTSEQPKETAKENTQPIKDKKQTQAETYDWIWPTQGTVIANYSNSEDGNKGIDIAGQQGQPVLASADGEVVYTGDALQGYGNLIIIKHKNNFLTAYAHNDTILVTENQQVKQGEQIATLGNSGTNSYKLHFEIRYQGKSVDPEKYLPKQ